MGLASRAVVRRRGVGVLLAALLLIPSAAAAAAREVVDRVAAGLEGREFRLGLDLHQAEPGGAQAPWLDERGWHHHDPNRPVVLRAGERVEVSGVFNYGDRGVFLEIARKELFGDVASRPRLRVRFMAAAEPEKPDDQEAQIRALVGRVLREVP